MLGEAAARLALTSQVGIDFYGKELKENRGLKGVVRVCVCKVPGWCLSALWSEEREGEGENKQLD